jgi:hypothetical protein
VTVVFRWIFDEAFAASPQSGLAWFCFTGSDVLGMRMHGYLPSRHDADVQHTNLRIFE